jgi:hypothetical protein
MHADVAKRANDLLIFIIRRQERRQQQREAESVATQLVLRANRKAVLLTVQLHHRHAHYHDYHAEQHDQQRGAMAKSTLTLYLE